MLCSCVWVASTICSGHPSARAAAAIFSMTCSLFFSLLLAMSMRQADIASKAVFTAWRASSESPATDIELKSREFAELSCMARLLSVRIDVPRDRGDPGDVFERRAIDDLNFCWTSFWLTERSLKGSRIDRVLSRTEKRGDSPCARKEKKNSSRNGNGDMSEGAVQKG